MANDGTDIDLYADDLEFNQVKKIYQNLLELLEQFIF